jgi:hypothetical protein
MAEADRNAASDHPAAAWFRRDIEVVEAELVAVLRKHWSRVGAQIVAHALIQTVGSVCGAIVEAEPAAGPDIDAKLADVRLYVATTNQRAQ